MAPESISPSLQLLSDPTEDDSLTQSSSAGESAIADLPRYQVRSLDWGDRTRFQIWDAVSETTLLIHANRSAAEDEVLFLNLNGRYTRVPTTRC